MPIYLQANLAFIRQHRRLSYAEMGEALGIPAPNLKTYENRGTTPPLETLVMLADWAGLTVDTLLRVELNDGNYLGPGVSPGVIADLQKRVAALEKKLGKAK